MVTLETNFNRIQELIGHKIGFKEFEEALQDLGMELEDKKDDLLTIDITAERPDLVSAEGMARAIRAMLGYKTKEYKAKESEYEIIVDKSVEKVRPYTVCAVVKDIDFDNEKIKEIIWVQEKLHATFGRNRRKAAIGIYPLERIKFPVFFKADKPDRIRFVPLDEEITMDGHEIITKTETGKQYAKLLEGLDRYSYFMDSNEEILSMPPIINSEKTGRVTERTKNIFIECSGFDLNALSQMLNIIVCMFEDMGGKTYEVNLNYPDRKLSTPMLQPEKRKISAEYINQVIGFKITSKQAATLLEKMMYKVIKVNSRSIELEVPPYRTDIWHDIDIVDDVVRAYGINNILPEYPDVPTQGKTFFETKLKLEVEGIMTGLGFQETFTYALTDKETQYKKMNTKEEKHVSLGRTAEQTINMVRTWLLPELMKSLTNNKDRGIPQKLFEIEEVVIPDKEKDVMSRNQTDMACAIIDNDSNYTKIKQVLNNILDTLGVEEASYEPTEHSSFLEGRVASIKIKDRKIGVIGEIHPKVLESFGLSYPVCAFEINMEEIANSINKN